MIKKLAFILMLSGLTFQISSLAKAKDGSSSYVLKTGIEAESTLERQHHFLAEESYRQLRKAGLKEG